MHLKLIPRLEACKQNQLLVSVVLLLSGTRHLAEAQENAVIQWNNAALQTIRYLRPGPTIDARALAVVHTCIFDAWSAYDDRALATVLREKLKRPVVERSEANKRKAVSFAAYRCLADLFPKEIPKYDAVMANLGFDPHDTSIDPKSPSGIGNLAAESVLRFRHHDGSNQLGDLHPGTYSDYTGYAPVNDSEHLNDPDRWQPLRTPVPDRVIYGKFIEQKFFTPHWGRVTPFALTSGSQFRPAKGPASFIANKDRYVAQAYELLKLSAELTDEQKMIVEYWADGPRSEAPPGHWCLFGQFVSARDHHTLDADVKMFFALTNAMLDASIAAWDAKRAFDSVRPISAIHLLFTGKTVQAWGGRFKGTQTIRGEDWQPYQPFVMAWTPNFPEFVSGHSTFSAAGATILKLFTGSDNFGASYSYLPGRSVVEFGLTPRNNITLSWPTFTAAADEAGMSRRYCGIHFADGDLAGRELGRQVAREVWAKVLSLINGKDLSAGNKPK